MDEPKLRRLLVPVDFSEVTGSVLDHAVYLARLAGSELLLLHVVHTPHLAEAGAWLEPVISPSLEQDIGRQLEQTAEQKLRELAGELESHGLSLQVMIRRGAPFAEIIKCAEENSADMIVMGAQGRGGLSNFLIGSVAERVVRRARCHVLCIKSSPEAEGD